MYPNLISIIYLHYYVLSSKFKAKLELDGMEDSTDNHGLLLLYDLKRSG